MVKTKHLKELVLTAICLLICISSYAFDFQANGIFYNKTSDNTVEVTRSSTMYYVGDITIPNIVTYDGTGYHVTAIGERAFRNCESLTSVIIPESVSSIGEYAFCGCSQLKSINIPDGVTLIEDYAFYGCKGLTSISISSGITSIGYYVFGYCRGLTSVNIPDGVTSIESCAFYECI